MFTIIPKCYFRLKGINELFLAAKCKISAQKSIFYSVNNFSVNNPEVQNYLAYLEEEYESLQSNLEKCKETNKHRRLSELKPIIEILQERKTTYKNLATLTVLSPEESNDKEYVALVEDERQIYKDKIEELDEELQEALLPVDRHSNSDVVLEVTAGVGGQEAMLFAREIFDMYCSYVEFKGWHFEIAQVEHTEIGGIRHASLFVSGDEAFEHLKHEGGVHRVQRIPVTEKAGRVHTSTVSVATLLQPQEVDIVIKDKDLRIETKRASGAGGQHVNTTDSAVRITHIPTGISVESQIDRSQIKNRAFALQRLRAKLFQQQLDQQIAETEATRKQQVGSSFRSEKIRTYNFNQDRITDHRVSGSVYNLRSFFSGGELLDSLMGQVRLEYNKELLLQTISQFRARSSKKI